MCVRDEAVWCVLIVCVGPRDSMIGCVLHVNARGSLGVYIWRRSARQADPSLALLSLTRKQTLKNLLNRQLITDNMDDIDDIGIAEEGFQVAQGKKRRRVTSSSSSSVAEVSKETQKKVFIKTETGKLNPIRVQRQVGALLGRSDVKIISRNNLLIVIAKNDDETVKLSSP